MTIYTTAELHCDWPRCRGRSEPGYNAADARQVANKRGWRRWAGYDFCGPSEPLDELTAWRRPRDHAAELLTGAHAPTLIRWVDDGGNGWRVVCACGWDDSDRPFTAPKQKSAAARWRLHLRDQLDKKIEEGSGGET